MLDASIALKNLIEEAANTTAEGITISDMTSPDHPLIYINEGFERLTCYARRDVLGKNCRFLQGKQTDQNTVDEIRHAIKEGKECTVELLNYRKDGRPFWNRLSINPLRSHSGSITHYVGVQSDITEMKETKERLEHANKRLEQFHQDITAELEQARRAQAFILPEPLPQSQAVRFASKFVPMDQIGGDFLM
jgi:PAS domain S-box-containing protein